ncbi:MAG: hypothetical protein HWN65_02740 [Candidatus Helarchaeota archaeon]|nr:hypothetical protein [Candidatus Helarchaeota archaeon]
MNEDEIFSFYGIPKEPVEKFKKQFIEIERAELTELTDAVRFEIYKLLFSRIKLFLEYSEFYRQMESKTDEWEPPIIHTKKELEELRQGFERDIRVQWKMLQAAALEGDWILRKIVGSPEKMEKFREQLPEAEE